jgi:hypothetical protein
MTEDVLTQWLLDLMQTPLGTGEYVPGTNPLDVMAGS